MLKHLFIYDCLRVHYYFPPGLAPIILRLPISVYARAYRLGAHTTTGEAVRVL